MPPRKYLALNRYLETLSPDHHSVALTFAELETLLGSPLPASKVLPHYWSTGFIARYNWNLSGFTAKLDRLERRVIFTRRPVGTPKPEAASAALVDQEE